MALIKRDIRFYQPNDPYYWQVDNLPLTDLLNNDVTLENRINGLEEAINGIGTDASGSFSVNALADLKAYSIPLSGDTGDQGKIFVRPGKFTARMQLPATRESGWRMMRDRAEVFNNEKFTAPGTDMFNTTTLTPFVRVTRGLARTSVVEFYANADDTNKYVNIDSFDSADFNGDSSPQERLDLIFIKGSKSLDTDGDSAGLIEGYAQDSLPAASIGVIKGAYFRTDAAGGVRTNGPRFTDATGRLEGRTTGQGQNQIPVNTVLPNFGTVPMPDDLLNLAWHKTSPTQTDEALAEYQVTTQAAFCLPIAYVRVPAGYVKGESIPQENIIDIRPFLRTVELSYSERAAIAASISPNGSNPFMTDAAFLSYYTPLESRVSTNENNILSNEGNIALNTSRIAAVEEDVVKVKSDVEGTGNSATSTSLNHEGRIAALETITGGGPQVQVERHKFLADRYPVFEQRTKSSLGTAESPTVWNITQAIPAADRAGLVAVQFRFYSLGNNSDTNSINYLGIKGGVQGWRNVSIWGVAQSNGDLRRNQGNVNTFYADVTKVVVSGTEVNLEFYTKCEGSGDVNHYCYIDGYIVSEGA